MGHDKDRYIGYVEMSLGVGDMIGPAIGGIMYDSAGYVGTFLIFGLMVFVGLVFCFIMIPSTLNKTISETRSNGVNDSESQIFET